MSQTALSVTDERAPIERLADLFDRQHGDEGLSASFFEADPYAGDTRDSDREWRFTLYCDGADVPRWQSVLEQLVVQIGLPAAVDVEPLGDRDWVAETLAELAPVRAGRFVVHGAHDRHAAREAAVAVEIDAGLAFGTGHHGTTAGCLELLDDVLKRRRPRRALDVGTGSAVLAIALAKAARVPVLATDIDPVATRVAAQNVRLNGCAPFVETRTAPGLQHPAFAHFGAADLVFANILAGPLKTLAGPISRHTAPGGEVILSGLLPRQGKAIVSAYRAHGLVLRRRIVRDGWLSLLMQR